MQCTLPRETLARLFVLAPIAGLRSRRVRSIVCMHTEHLTHPATNWAGRTCLEGIVPLLTTAGANCSACCRGKLWPDCLCLHPLLACSRAACPVQYARIEIDFSVQVFTASWHCCAMANYGRS